MRAKSRLFNHPVLSSYNDDFKEGFFDLEILDINISTETLKLSIKFSLEEPTIENLIKNQIASYGILIECPKTSERYYHSYSTADAVIEIDNANLNDFIRIQGFVLSEQRINDFHSDAFNELFEDTRFIINSKSILAYSKEIKAKLDFESDNISSIQSIFKIIKKLDFKDDEIQIEKESDFLQIYISEKRYHEYMQIKKLTKENPEIMHATLIIPTLTYVISTLDKDDLEAYDYPWYNALSHSFQEKGLNLDKSLLENKSSFELANRLMASPTLSSMSAINQVFKIQLEGEDDY